MQERIQKIIAGSGLVSRRKAEQLISDGLVTVDGVVAKLGDKADATQNVIRVDGKDIRQTRKVYLAFNKPAGCLVSTTGSPDHKTIYDVARFPEKVFYAGRLDFNTKGLLLMTNDGTFSNRVTHPGFNTEKTYIAGMQKAMEPIDLERLNKGIRIDGRLVEVKARMLKDKQLEIILHEGRKHIVKRLLGHLGYGVFSLERTRIGAIRLGDLKPGQWRPLTGAEIKSVLH